MKTPQQTVLDFIIAYEAWNSTANSRLGKVDDLTALNIARCEYRELVACFCSTTVVPQGCHFGDDSSHDSEREIIESVEVQESTAVVRTRHCKLDDFVTNYEYHLKSKNNVWRIASLLVVLVDGKYECL